ncbi:MAG: hypothetical protein ABSF44_11635 [Candidatus Bathyarchaeia archaeon]
MSDSIGKSLPVFTVETLEYWIIFGACLFLSIFLELSAHALPEIRSSFAHIYRNKSAPLKTLPPAFAQTSEAATTQSAALTEAPPETSMPIHSVPTPVSQFAEKNMSGNSDANILEIDIDPNALNYLKKNGDVFILTDFENPQYSYYRIKGYDANLLIEFKEFVDICKTYLDNSRTEFTTATFNVRSPINLKRDNLGFYLAKSGFSTINDWLKTLKDEDAIPECSTGHKTFYLYHIHVA